MIINLIGWSFNKLYQIITLHTLNIYTFISQFVFLQSLSCIWLFVTPLTASRQAPLSFTLSQSLLRFTSIESVMLSNHLILCCPLILLPSVFPSIRIFSNESALHVTWPKYWSFSISPTNEYSGLTSFRTDWFDRLAVQGTLKSLTCFMEFFKKKSWGNPLVAQWLGLQGSTAADAGSIPGLGTKTLKATVHPKA